jgi:hypothetical protein
MGLMTGASNNAPELETLADKANRIGLGVIELGLSGTLHMSAGLMRSTTCFTSIFFSSLCELNNTNHNVAVTAEVMNPSTAPAAL